MDNIKYIKQACSKISLTDFIITYMEEKNYLESKGNRDEIIQEVVDGFAEHAIKIEIDILADDNTDYEDEF